MTDSSGSAGDRKESVAARRFWKGMVIVAASLLPTPLLLFISSSSALYLKNQALLQRQTQVLLPFVGLSLITWSVGGVLYRLARGRVSRCGLWAYSLLGPWVLVFSFVRQSIPKWPFLNPLVAWLPGVSLWPALLVATAFLLSRRQKPIPVKWMAAFGVALLVSEAFLFVSRVEPFREPGGRASPAVDRQGSARHLPNVYHILLDEFQTDLFAMAMTPEIQSSLGGFVWFPETTAVQSYTPMSLASLFSGRAYAYDRVEGTFISQAFNSRASFLYWLKKQGYATYAYVPSGGFDVGSLFGTDAPFHFRLFDHFHYHKDNANQELVRMNTEAFWDLWLYTSLPEPVHRRLRGVSWLGDFKEEDTELLGDQRLLPKSAPVVSYLGFQRFTELEPDLPSSSRYTYLHVLLPHYPFKLHADCSFGEASVTIHPVDQATCTLRLLVTLLELLKKLGRFEESLVIVHADHGGPYRVQDGQLQLGARSRSLRSLLLVKPIGYDGTEGFRRSLVESSLLDVAPMIIRSVGAVIDDAADHGPLTSEAGQERRIMPFVEGETLEAAERILRRQGFQPGHVVSVTSELFGRATVIAQNPGPYEEDLGDRKVELLVSLGPPQSDRHMPDLIGERITEVIERSRRGEVPPISAIREVDYPGVTEGTIVRQSPRIGAKLEEGASIVLFVSGS